MNNGYGAPRVNMQSTALYPGDQHPPPHQQAASSFPHASRPLLPPPPPPGYIPPPPPPPESRNGGWPSERMIIPPPPPPSVGSSPAIISAAPTTYSSRPRLVGRPHKQQKQQQNNRNKPSTGSATAAKSSAQLMAEKVASSVVTVTQAVPAAAQPSSSTAAAAEETPVEQTEKPHKMAGKMKRPKKYLRSVGGKVWEDKSLMEWNPGDFRVFAGDLGNDVTEEVLQRYFSVYPSLTRVHVVRDKRTGKAQGYGFLSFSDSDDYVRAMREMNGKYVGSRPIKLKKSQWKDRQLSVVKRKQRDRNAMGML